MSINQKINAKTYIHECFYKIIAIKHNMVLACTQPFSNIKKSII